ncbi:hypothetical protein FQN60_002114 [Etheostoma spectabile]|uniref:Uncharacterized protein n=1 Tax=Etheostoma spectabile TaxID=54343 RepID=A0A5J5DDU4_9PERO|nr:hypothetical protein FQN60_002114 [Etheostoma spectabile]
MTSSVYTSQLVAGVSRVAGALCAEQHCSVRHVVSIVLKMENHAFAPERCSLSLCCDLSLHVQRRKLGSLLYRHY